MKRSVPSWVPDAVFYQIFPDRFRRGGDDWTTDPNAPGGRDICGGNLAGIREAIAYLADLGVTALYLTPVFHAASYHKYDTLDYFQIDPAFGSNEEFGTLVRSLHERGIRIVLDGVFNHCSVEHPFFLDVVERGRGSQYWEWFTVRGDRVVERPEPNYARWAGVRSMPEWNHDHPPVTEYLLSVVRYWIEEHGIDGWRLDTTEYLPPDFVRKVYQAAKASSPDVYILGEVMGLGTPWFRHQALDGVMHYKLWEAITEYLVKESWDAATLWHSVRAHWFSYPEDANYGSYTLISSHDRPRFLTQCDGDVRRFLLGFVFQFAFPGAPAVYYGDEIGLEGGDDPDNRRCFPWDRALWNGPLTEEVRRLIALRKNESALRTGTVRQFHTEGRFLVFERADASARFLIAINAETGTSRRFALPDGTWSDALHQEARRGDQEIPARSYAVYCDRGSASSRS